MFSDIYILQMSLVVVPKFNFISMLESIVRHHISHLMYVPTLSRYTERLTPLTVSVDWSRLTLFFSARLAVVLVFSNYKLMQHPSIQR
jgi:hypothetical protein